MRQPRSSFRLGRWRWLPLLVALPLAGCQSGEARVPVAGRVVYGDAPITQGAIVFHNREAGIAVAAPLGADGGFQVKTHRGEGLPAGRYTISISPHGVGQDPTEMPIYEPDPSATATPSLPPRYHSAETSGIELEIQAGNEPYEIRIPHDG